MWTWASSIVPCSALRRTGWLRKEQQACGQQVGGQLPTSVGVQAELLVVGCCDENWLSLCKSTSPHGENTGWGLSQGPSSDKVRAR